MCFLQAIRDCISPSTCGARFIRTSFRIERSVADYLVPMIESMATGSIEGWSQLNALRQFFIGERPFIAILKGDEIWLNIEGPEYTCGDATFPLGSQLMVERLGWLNLGPADTVSLHRQVREAIDTAAFKWLSENSKIGQVAPQRIPRDRPVDDEIALRQMASAACQSPPQEGAIDA